MLGVMVTPPFAEAISTVKGRLILEGFKTKLIVL
jgi:hypothetical protein